MKQILASLFVFFIYGAIGQNSTIQGTVLSGSSDPLSDVVVTLEPGGQSAFTNFKGRYQFSGLAAGTYTLKVEKQQRAEITVTVGDNETVVADPLILKANELQDDLNTFSDLSVLEAGDESGAASSLLSASRDVYLNKAGFQFGSDVFFRVRGYDSRYSSFMVNGVRYENPETGWQPFNLVGGLNDVLRYTDIETVGSEALTNGFGEAGGTRNYNLRPSNYGKGGRVTYSHLNRSYNNRVMATFASGEQPSGLSYVVSGSKRWAQEGYIDGTYYDAYAGYAAVEGKISDNYSLMVSAMMSPRRRGTQSIHRQEAYDVMGDNFYNADWGWQNGEKRNARLRKNFNPILTISNYIDVSPKTKLQLTGSFMTGSNIGTRIERSRGANPDPDYYRNLPSFLDLPSGVDGTSQFELSPQIDWTGFYRANTTLTEDDFSPYAGLRANYILEENVRDDRDIQAVAQFNSKINENITLDYGANFRDYTGNFYKRVADLMGADYWLDRDDFNFDPNDPNSAALIFNNNVDNTELRRYTGDRFGFDYDLNRRTYDSYVQARFAYDKIDLFVGGNLGYNEFWREGNFNNQKFEDVSKGKGEVEDFLTYGAKAGGTYKIDGRNYVSASGMFYTKPPVLTTMWITPNSRNMLNPRNEMEQVYTGEASFYHKSPKLKLRATGYAGRFDNQAESLLAFAVTGQDNPQADDNNLNFGNFYTNGIDKLHYGGEMGFDYTISPDFSVSGAANVGKYTIMSRPVLTGFSDALSEPIFNENSSFLLDFYEDNTPQTATNLGLNYRGPKRIFANIDANYYTNSYAGASTLRRTLPIAQQLEHVRDIYPDNPEFQNYTTEESIKFLTKQERLPDAFRLNLSLYKDFRISYERSIGVNLMVNNVLDDQDYANLAFEDFRVQDTDRDGRLNPNDFPTRYRYATGRTFFLNVAYKFR